MSHYSTSSLTSPLKSKLTGILIRVINYVCIVFLDGKFGASMQVHIQNEGPVTIELVSPSPTTDPRLVCLILLTHLVYVMD